MAVEGVMVTYNYSDDATNEHANIMTVAASGIKFSDRWVLTHGSILSPLKQAHAMKNAKGKPLLSEEFYDKLPEIYVTCESKGYVTAEPNIYENIERMSRQRDSGDSNMEHSSYQVRVLTGRICHVWQCPILDRCVDDILYSWTIGHRDGDMEKQTQLGKALLSVFVLVDLESDNRVLKTLRPLSELLDIVKPSPGRGSAIELHSTPFGCEVFLNAVTRGSVCGVVGKRPSLLLTDAATALGSEGGPVFTEGPKKELIGAVVCSVSWWRGEWVGLTLVAPLVSVLAAKLKVSPAPLPPLDNSVKKTPTDLILERVDRCTVMVRCGEAWGAAVYVGGGYVATCAHVVRQFNTHKVSVYCQGRKETAIVRYKTKDDRAYDLALLYTNPEQWSFLAPAIFADKPPQKGERVLAAGFPYFSEKHIPDLRPTLTAGHLNNVSPSMIQTSCCVQSGFSGGPIFRVPPGAHEPEVIGVIVSNARTNTGACFPYINMAVPTNAFLHTVRHFIADKGMEVYSDFCGSCLATGNAIRKGKLELGQDRIAMVKALADNVTVLSRFKDKSEPVFLFIVKGKLTRAMFGANGIELCRIIEEELGLMQREIDTGWHRHKIEVHEMLPEEATKLEEDLKMEAESREATERLRVLTLAARKKRVSERLSRYIARLNFIMFWPHCHQAHYDLYEKWDAVNITVAAKDEIQLTEEMAKEALYMSDVEPNEACIYSLLKGPILMVLFKMFDTDNRDFVRLMRYCLYEEIPVPKEDVPPEKQVPPIPAYERYASISKTKREVRRDRYEARMQKLVRLSFL